MNADWWKKLEDAVNTAVPKVKQAAQTVVTHVNRAADVAVATWEKEQISQKIGSAWTTAKAEWTDRKPTQPKNPKTQAMTSQRNKNVCLLPSLVVRRGLFFLRKSP